MPLIGLGVISLIVFFLNIGFKTKYLIVSYIFSVIGIFFGYIARMVYDNKYNIYEHNLAGVELVVITLFSAFVLSIVYHLNKLLSENGEG